ncbi:MAG: DUF2225 domain-containing protein [Clostridium sp.]|nr:DUF2225 domain-containing protein [Clostridium sp.]
MARLLDGLAGLGLNNLAGTEIYEKEEKAKAADTQETKTPEAIEKEFLYEKTMLCPVCNEKFNVKIMKTGKAKLIGTDFDLRPRYEGIDVVKYDAVLCPHCGYAALTRYFEHISAGPAKLIKENISKNVQLHKYNDEIYTYEEAKERYTLCLANAVVKRARNSEKAYVCLKSAWLFRGYAEYLATKGEAQSPKYKELKEQEEVYLQNAYDGFKEACASELFPMCGMDETTVDYLMAELAAHLKKYDEANKLISGLLTSNTANPRIKDKARDLKTRIVEEKKKQG